MIVELPVDIVGRAGSTDAEGSALRTDDPDRKEVAEMATRTAPKTAAKTARKVAPKRTPKVAPKVAPKTPKTPVAATGPKAETLARAAKVVKLRDSGKSWSEVADAMGVDYSTGYSSLLRRLYVIGNGETVGVRKAKLAANAEAAKVAKTAKRGKRTAAKATPAKRETATERRARLGRESVASGS